MNADQRRLNEITEKIIGGCYRVANGLGAGFLEKVYENALAHALRKTGLVVEQQKQVRILYDGVVAGEYWADLLIENAVIVELKAVKSLDEIHVAQCLNYLRGADLRLGLLVNFGTPKIKIQRIANNF